MSLLHSVRVAMEKFAPLTLADASWDNVGILVENPKPNATNVVLLTIDLTNAVMEECKQKGVEVIVAYHPPIFAPLKRLTLSDPKQRTILSAIANGMSVYCPHTALDNTSGGINDWLSDLVQKGCDRDAVVPLESPNATGKSHCVGMGRIGKLRPPRTAHELLVKLQVALGIPSMRVAHTGPDADFLKTIKVASFAVCAGSGSSVLKQLKKPVDFILSGEMGHHDVLSFLERGSVVALTEHTNCERGFLSQRLQSYLESELGERVHVLVSEVDRDPLRSYQFLA